MGNNNSNVKPLSKTHVDTDELLQPIHAPEEAARILENKKQHISEKPSSHNPYNTVDSVKRFRNIGSDILSQANRAYGNMIIDINLQPPNWIEDKRNDPSRNKWFDIDTCRLPLHWKQHIPKEPSRDDIEWFSLLLTSYDQHRNKILEILSTSKLIEESIRYPDDLEDEIFDDFARQSCSETDFDIPFLPNKAEMKQQLGYCINKCQKKKMTLIKLGKIIEEHKRLKSEGQKLYEKNIKLQELRAQENEEILRIRKQKDKALRQEKRSVKDLKRVQDQIEQEREKVRNIQHQLQQMTKEKDHLLTRLSKIAGSKLTSNNPDIADLNDDNRPTKLAEKFGQLYDDAWTDSMEELTGVETRINDRDAISFLLRIVMTAYQFCSGSRSMFLDLTDCQTILTCKDNRAMKAITKLPDAITPDIQQATKTCLHAKETTLISEIQEKFANTLNGILSDITRKADSTVSNRHTMNPRELVEVKGRKKECLDQGLLDSARSHSQSKGVEDDLRFAKKRPHSSESTVTRRKNVSISASADFSQSLYDHYSRDKLESKKEEAREPIVSPTYCQTMLLSSLPQFAKTTHFAKRCLELCWFMQTTRPPIHLSASIPTDGRMNNDILRAYTKSGTNVDYIVWPVIYLYENGPVLNKGIAQPK